MLKLKLLIASFLFISNMAFAETHSTYLFTDVGSLNSGDFCDTGNSGVTLSSCSKSTTAYLLGTGYTASNGWGVELAYANFGSFTANGNGTVAGTPFVLTMKTSASAFLLPATYAFKLNDTSSIMLKFGLAFTKGASDATGTSGGLTIPINTKGSGSALIYGLGFTQNLSDIFSVRIQYDVINKLVLDDTPPASGINNLGLFSIGIVAGF